MCNEHSSGSTRSPSPLARLLIGAVRGYQKYLSPLKMGSTCRFEPTCSAYALQAVQLHGAVRGVVLAGVRLSKCGPWHPGGYDPVPQRGVNTRTAAQDDQT
ncbi:membrane protein insertion efficiency factor YidD [Corynebacterium sp.]|uniref:membrane protein insertion efficiency factor YidD n=1 Tax=Corynebacterium sp. TaxID=1720 RepID=UPI0026DC0759|nr:membrane protein insertion efficiency factor YidD [Corynebacterium sp.]MDO5077631.1 membrane protein insertion efficiency factor YidD [Corynebacterium sp.]